jgi:hypothetical protein
VSISLVLIIVAAWVVLGLVALVFVLAIGRAAKRGDELLWRESLTRMLSARGRRAMTRRDGDRRTTDAFRQLPWAGTSERRRQDRRSRERRADPAWRDSPNG